LENDAHQRGAPSKDHFAGCFANVTADVAPSHRVDLDFRVRGPQT
jgi:hypothetical protein